jgi:hypothetical protein
MMELKEKKRLKGFIQKKKIKIELKKGKEKKGPTK